jgi:tetratricopeptide (TPR) repeat protein
VAAYPNKIAYANLAEVARRCGRHDDALALFDLALRLDPDYANGWDERACLEIEMATLAAQDGDMGSSRRYVAEATIHHARAVRLADNETVADRLSKDFEAQERHHGPA